MSNNTNIQRAVFAQQQATSPRDSVWVMASAGTGKTKTLIDRIIRLLLAGADPSSIVCLTYTRAAAFEIRQRLMAVTALWMQLKADALQAHLSAAWPDEDWQQTHVQRAQQLYMLLQQGSSIQIGTIHSFCQTMLTRHANDMGLSPMMTLAEEWQSATLKRQAMDDVLQQRDIVHDDALNVLLNMTSLDGLVEKLSAAHEYINKGHALPARPHHLSYESLMQRLHMSVDELRARQQCLDNLAAWRLLLRTLLSADKLSPTMKKRLDALSLILQQATDSSFVADAVAVVTNKTGGWPQPWRTVLSFATNQQPSLIPLVEATDRWHEDNRIKQYIDEVMAFNHLLSGYLEAYRLRKNEHHFVDYHDLILMMIEWLDQSNAPTAIGYDLFKNIQHLLIDEAQDTNMLQWRLMQLLVAQWFDADQAIAARSVMVVGDPKQAIYRFQGATPEQMSVQQQAWQSSFGQQSQQLKTIALDVSFRALPNVLQVVDGWLQSAAIQAPQHLSARASTGGCVEMWPILEPVDQHHDETKWPLPHQRKLQPDAGYFVAEYLAEHIQHCLSSGTVLPSTGKPICPQDILILFAKRANNSVWSNLKTALKKRHIAVDDNDQARLTDHPTLIDLYHVLRWLLNVADDWSLMVILKSPLVGLSDAQVAVLRTDKQPLFQQLQQAAHHDTAYRAIVEQLLTWRQKSFGAVIDVVSHVLYREGGLQKMIARLGESAQQACEQWLQQLIKLGEQGVVSLADVVVWWSHVGDDAPTLHQTASFDAVRMMTVHGAKGLQAPIVYMVDAITRRDQKIEFYLASDDAPQPVVFHGMRAENEFGRLHDWRTHDRWHKQQDAQNVLYVALTRAADQLFIVPYATRSVDEEEDDASASEPQAHPLSWYGQLINVMQACGQSSPWQPVVRQSHLICRGDVWRCGDSIIASSSFVALPQPVLQKNQQPPANSTDLWRPITMARTPSFLSPSHVAAELKEWSSTSAAAADHAADHDDAAQFGRWLHHVLAQWPVDRLQLEQWLQKLQHDAAQWPRHLHQPLCATMNLLKNNHEWLNLQQHRLAVEVPIRGHVDGIDYWGRIDAVCRLPEGDLLLDYKSGYHSAHASLAAQRQLHIYQQLWRQATAVESVSAAIVWTRSGQIERLGTDNLRFVPASAIVAPI